MFVKVIQAPAWLGTSTRGIMTLASSHVPKVMKMRRAGDETFEIVGGDYSDLKTLRTNGIELKEIPEPNEE